MKIVRILLVIAIYMLLSLMLCSCRSKPEDTDHIDGGVQHYEDTNAPKFVKSEEITVFSCEFSATNLPLNESSIAGRYYTFYAGEDSGSFEARGDGVVYEKQSFVPDTAFFAQLQKIVAKYNLAQYNGEFYTVSGLPPDLGVKLDIQYASGENIRASNNQSCFLPIEAMEALVELFHAHNAAI